MTMLPESTREKSALLIRAMDWQWHWFNDDDRLGWYLMSGDVEMFGSYEYYIDLYTPENMALAWRVLNWADTQTRLWREFFFWWYEDFDATGTPPVEAQAAWLDKVLELAIEAGLVEVDNVT